LPHYAKDPRTRSQDHLGHQEGQKKEEGGHCRGLLAGHWGCGLRWAVAMPLADEWGCYSCYFGGEAEADIVHDAVAPFPASHCVPVRDAQGLLAVVMHVAYVAALRAHVPALARSPAGRAIDCSS
jgi:hypothetical protein